MQNFYAENNKFTRILSLSLSIYIFFSLPPVILVMCDVCVGDIIQSSDRMTLERNIFQYLC